VGEKKRGGWPALVGCVISVSYKALSDSDFGPFQGDFVMFQGFQVFQV